MSSETNNSGQNSGQVNLYNASNFEKVPFVLDMTTRDLSGYTFETKVASSLKAEKLLEDEYVDEGSGRSELDVFYLRGHSTISNSRALNDKEMDLPTSDGGVIRLWRGHNNRIEVEAGEWNPYKTSNVFSIADVLEALRQAVPHEDIALSQLGVAFHFPDKVGDLLGVDDDCAIYHGLQNVTPLGISANPLETTTKLKSAMRHYGVPRDKYASIGDHSKSVLFTDYLLLDNGLSHKHMHSVGVLDTLISSISGNRRWSWVTGVGHDPAGIDIPVYELRGSGETMVFRHNRE